MHYVDMLADMGLNRASSQSAVRPGLIGLPSRSIAHRGFVSRLCERSWIWYDPAPGRPHSKFDFRVQFTGRLMQAAMSARSMQGGFGLTA